MSTDDPLVGAGSMRPMRDPSELISWIRDAGSVGVDAYMQHCLSSYYGAGDVFGRSGDFVTAPEISQVFGELLGLWAAVAWQSMGSPDRVVLAEVGPGRGTLMADALRALAPVPAFAAAAQVHLVETSSGLRKHQAAVLGGRVTAWHETVEQLPDGPLILLANEFLDALPIRQHVRTETGWRERLITADPAERQGSAATDSPLGWCLGPEQSDPPMFLSTSVAASASPGQIVETAPQAHEIIATLSQRLACQGGMALFIDYGPAQSAPGDSLQAVRHHQSVPVLATPGQADITAHVDFAALAETARTQGVRVDGPVQQAVFLLRLGIEARGAQLINGAPENKAEVVRAGVHRLIDPDEMGILFKVLCLRHSHLPGPPGF